MRGHDASGSDEHENPRARVHQRQPFVEPTPTGLLRIDAIAAGVAATTTTPARRPSNLPPRHKACAGTPKGRGRRGRRVRSPGLGVATHWTDSPRPSRGIRRGVLRRREILRGPTWRQEAESFLDEEDMRSSFQRREPTSRSLAARSIRELPFGFALEIRRGHVVDAGDRPARARRGSRMERGARGGCSGQASRRARPTSATHQRHAPRPSSPASTEPCPGRDAHRARIGGGGALSLLRSARSRRGARRRRGHSRCGRAFCSAAGCQLPAATLPGLVAVPAMVVAAYLRGPVGVIGRLGRVVLDFGVVVSLVEEW